MGIELEAMRDDGSLLIEQVDAAEVSPGEFADEVRSCVEKEAIRTVIIDSLNGYQNAMPEEKFLILHMHELLQYLNRLGAATFLTVAQHGLVGDMKAPVDVTYLADTVWFCAILKRSVVVLTERGAGVERNPAAERQMEALGNVSFLERPFHPTTLISVVKTALRGRRRQYEARARLEALHQSESYAKRSEAELRRLNELWKPALQNALLKSKRPIGNL
jgi:hypothetical protein